MNFYKLLRYGYAACKDDKKLYYHKGAIEREALLVSDDIYKFKYSIRNAEQFSKELLIHNVMKKPCTARLTGPCATRLSVMENGREAVKGLFGGSALRSTSDMPSMILSSLTFISPMSAARCLVSSSSVAANIPANISRTAAVAASAVSPVSI